MKTILNMNGVANFMKPFDLFAAESSERHMTDDRMHDARLRNDEKIYHIIIPSSIWIQAARVVLPIAKWSVRITSAIAGASFRMTNWKKLIRLRPCQFNLKLNDIYYLVSTPEIEMIQCAYLFDSYELLRSFSLVMKGNILK